MMERSVVRKNSGGRQHTAAHPAVRVVLAAFTALAVLMAPTCMMTSARPLHVSPEILATASRCSSVRIGPSPVLPAIQNPPHPCEILSSSSARKAFSLTRPSSVVGVGGAGNTPLNSSFMLVSASWQNRVGILTAPQPHFGPLLSIRDALRATQLLTLRHCPAATFGHPFSPQ